jgi:plastocyanin
MARRSAIVIAAAFLNVLIVPAVPAAAGGGGCHTGATQGTGDTVELVDACPTPTILTIDPGGTVSFVNEDPFAHNVIGSAWGHPEDLNQGDGFTATFDEPGVYPWACWYHPGMTGAIVVGDGTGVGNGAVVDVSSFSQPEPSPVVEVRTVTRQASGTPAVAGWVIGPVLGIGIGLGIAALIRRRPRPAA